MDIKKYMLVPSEHFDRPSDVLELEGLSTDERIRILESWKLDVQRLESSRSEGLSGEDNSQLLQAVENALLSLGAR